MANPTVPDFTERGARKLAELQANGYRITGVCFERQVEGTQPQRGFVDFAGFVGWWRPEMRPRSPLTAKQSHELLVRMFGEADSWGEGLNYEPTAEQVSGWCVEFLVRELTAHGVADMKGGQDVDR